jgi:hypothetical protein
MAANYSIATTWPSDAEELRGLLGVMPAAVLKCHGTTQKGEPCKLRVSKESASNIEVLLGQIAAGTGSVMRAEASLDRLAGLVLCKRIHQKTSSKELLQRWTLLLKALGASDEGEDDEIEAGGTAGGGQESDETNYEDGMSMDTRTDAVNIKLETTRATKPISSPDSKTIPANPPVDKHTFEPFRKPKTTLELNKSIKKLLQRRLRATERPGSKGFLYVYTFPTRYRLRTPHLKIGHARDVTRRMADWRRQCGYEPSLLSCFSAELHVKVERLVHAQLWNRRRRETCCPVCGGAHREWFEVKETEASGLISLWSYWSRLEPYDEEGQLKGEWRERLEEVDLEDENCWNDFVYAKSGV